MIVGAAIWLGFVWCGVALVERKDELEGAVTMFGIMFLFVLAFTIYDQIAAPHNRKKRGQCRPL